MTQEAAAPTVPALDRFLVTGANHRTAGQELRDALFIEDRALAPFFDRLSGEGVGEALVLATCDRVEIAAMAPDGTEADAAARKIRRVLADTAGINDSRVEGAFFTLTGPQAARHLFAIAASLESQVVGEPEVLGQVKDAHRRATELGRVGPGLNRVLEAALACAKRARSETAIGESAVSIVSAAVQVAREVLGRFDHAHALIVGGAEIGVAVAERLKGDGLGAITVADPLAPRADALAARLGAHRLAMEALGGALAGFDVVLTGLGSRAPPVRAADVATALKSRRFRPMFLLDAGVPADIERAVADIDDAYLFNLHDLERLALKGQARRMTAAAEARAIVDDELARFALAEGGRAAAPVVTELRGHFEAVRENLLREQPGLSADEATRILVNRLLHAPSRALRDMAADADAPREPEGWIARLFGIRRDK